GTDIGCCGGVTACVLQPLVPSCAVRCARYSVAMPPPIASAKPPSDANATAAGKPGAAPAAACVREVSAITSLPPFSLGETRPHARPGGGSSAGAPAAGSAPTAARA